RLPAWIRQELPVNASLREALFDTLQMPIESWIVGGSGPSHVHGAVPLVGPVRRGPPGEDQFAVGAVAPDQRDGEAPVEGVAVDGVAVPVARSMRLAIGLPQRVQRSRSGEHLLEQA